MPNFKELPLYSSQVVLYPAMPLHLCISHGRELEMMERCWTSRSPFGILLAAAKTPNGSSTTPAFTVGTTARIVKMEKLADGQIEVLVTGEQRFKILRTIRSTPFSTVEAIAYESLSDPSCERNVFTITCQLFRKYVKMLFRRTGRNLSCFQLPQQADMLSYAIAAFLPISLAEKQQLLEIHQAERRLRVEKEILERELNLQSLLPRLFDDGGLIQQVDSETLGRLRIEELGDPSQ